MATLPWVSGAVIGAVVGVRLVWSMGTWAVFGRWWRRREADEPYTWRETMVTWWAGQRGVATVALALAVPLTTESGAAFPWRNGILFTAFALVLFTLLIQGPTLSLVVRATGVRVDTESERLMERQLWTRILRAELTRLQQVAQTEDLPDEVYDRLHVGIERRLARADPEAADDAKAAAEGSFGLNRKLDRINQEVLAAGRTEAMAARREPGVPPDLVDRVMRRLDLRSP
ncbi:cation:proton antiporter [Nocardia sp. CS682]|uniref:cation:proton antiporter domain-containing protein n=1 Tax=Nocardia sp. CS682 TaxID=1047172 RepID=UPI0021037937|nr:cation:proton antiporter [Nocardia sp. CS682]